jgi:hypothetical protein
VATDGHGSMCTVMLGRHTTVHALEDFIPIYYVNTGELGARHSRTRGMRLRTTGTAHGNRTEQARCSQNRTAMIRVALDLGAFAPVQSGQGTVYPLALGASTFQAWPTWCGATGASISSFGVPASMATTWPSSLLVCVPCTGSVAPAAPATPQSGPPHRRATPPHKPQAQAASTGRQRLMPVPELILARLVVWG